MPYSPIFRIRAFKKRHKLLWKLHFKRIIWLDKYYLTRLKWCYKCKILLNLFQKHREHLVNVNVEHESQSSAIGIWV